MVLIQSIGAHFNQFEYLGLDWLSSGSGVVAGNAAVATLSSFEYTTLPRVFQYTAPSDRDFQFIAPPRAFDYTVENR